MFKIQRRLFSFTVAAGVVAVLVQTSCSTAPTEQKAGGGSSDLNRYYSGIGVGPVTAVDLSAPVNPEMKGKGSEIFNTKCIACHDVTDKRKIGPGLAGVTKRRKGEWIMNQMLNPMGMTQNDSMSKALLAVYTAQMTDMQLNQEEARAVLEFLRSNDQ